MELFLFSGKAVSLLRDEMCICLEDLQKRLISTSPTKLEFFTDFFDFLAELNPPHTDVAPGGEEHHENNQFLNNEMSPFFKGVDVEADTEEYVTIDCMCHAFKSFKNHGLLYLYKNREAENWYPKVVIRKKLRVDHLPENIVIYRGTSKFEFSARKFSQSWTLSPEIAHDFAFKHYASQNAYINTERVVLKAKISALNIYYYDDADNEHEIIIDEREINDVNVISQSVL